MNRSTRRVVPCFVVLAAALLMVAGCRLGGGAPKARVASVAGGRAGPAVKAQRDKERIPDSDGDGVPDNADLCPDDLEDWDGDRDEDGCPDTDPPADCFDMKGRRCLHGSLLRVDPEAMSATQGHYGS